MVWGEDGDQKSTMDRMTSAQSLIVNMQIIPSTESLSRCPALQLLTIYY